MASVDVLSLSSSSLEEGCCHPYDYHSATDSSGSLTFVPLFPAPGLFPYHAIGGSIDPRNTLDTSSFGGSSTSYPSRVAAIEVTSKSTESQSIVDVEKEYPFIRHVSMEVDLPDRKRQEDDDESLGNCSDLTECTDLAERFEKRDSTKPIQSEEDLLVWQQWQARFKRSNVSLFQNTNPIDQRNSSEEGADLWNLPMDPDTSIYLPRPAVKASRWSRGRDLLEDESFNPKEERHMQLHQTLPAITEDIHEAAPFQPPVAKNADLPLVPLRRNHSPGGGQLEDEVVAMMKRMAEQMKFTN